MTRSMFARRLLRRSFPVTFLGAALVTGLLSGSVDAQIFHRKDPETKQEQKAEKAAKKNKPTPENPLAGVNSKQPDKALFDKALLSLKKNRFDVARLQLQALLNTYPESEYVMRAKLAVADSWYKEGGTAALAQAESEYKDFITFFPNTPEAAEAQMRVADIYYKQMEKPDRDYDKTQKAEAEYRAMITQFPDSPLVPQAKQKLREVQEVLAERQKGIADFYFTHENWPASIARYQTLVDTYPLYSHSDEALLGLGDAYSAEAKIVGGLKLPEGAKGDLVKHYQDLAANAYAQIVTRYPLAPRADDAKDRLLALNRPVPEATKDALALNEAEEQSKVPVKLQQRALLLVSRGPSTVSAVRVGEPTMADPKPTTAPEIAKSSLDAYNAAMHIGTPNASGAPATGSASANPGPTASEAPRAGTTAAPALEEVPGGDTTIGATILNSTGAPAATPPSNQPVEPASGSPQPTTMNAAPSGAGGLAPVGPKNATPLPPIEQPAAPADQVNDLKNSAAQPAPAQQQPTNGKKVKKPKYNSSDQSDSKHKKKKGIDKLNPF